MSCLIEIRKPPLNSSLLADLPDRRCAGRVRQDIESRLVPPQAMRSAPAPTSPIRSGRAEESAQKDPRQPADQPLYVSGRAHLPHKKRRLRRHGAPIGGGLGLAYPRYFRVTCPEAALAATSQSSASIPASPDPGRFPMAARTCPLIFYPTAGPPARATMRASPISRAAGPVARRGDDARAEIAECSHSA